jgi:hypothetical protein
MNAYVNNVPKIGKIVADKPPSHKREKYVRLPRATQEIVAVEPIVSAFQNAGATNWVFQ